jgi:hypothetical protein
MKVLSIVLGVLVCVMFAQGAQAATIFSDNFNGVNGGNGALNYTGFSQWNVSGGAVDLIGNGFFDFFPGTGLSVDLDGTMFQSGQFSSIPIALTGGTYMLQFALGGSQRGDTNTVQVSLGSFYSESFTLGSSAPLSVITRFITVGAPSSASLTFQNAGGDNIGLILDDVNLSTTEIRSVPETSSLALLAFGLTGIGMLRLRTLKYAQAGIACHQR